MMNSSKSGSHLSRRLQALFLCYQSEKRIWDIGCDHANLGLAFAQTKEVEEIHLVDSSVVVMAALETRLKDSYITKSRFHLHLLKGEELKIDQKSNIIFLTGMGGKTIAVVIRHLLPQLDESSQIVISPHRKILELRTFLHSLDIGCEEEKLIEENDKFYQILRLRPKLGVKVPLFGKGIWEGKIGERYLREQLHFFKKHKDPLSQGYVTFLERLHLKNCDILRS